MDLNPHRYQRRTTTQIIVAFFLALGFSLVFSTAAAGAASAAVHQGDAIYSDIGVCTVGYVKGNAAYSAAHCASNGANAYDAHGNHVGTWVHEGSPDSHHTDIARIDLHPGQGGGNPYSGDDIAPTWAASSGTPICKQGVTTGVTCGVITHREGNAVHTLGAVPSPGDSGGPAWIPGIGYVGEATVYWTHHDGTYTGTYTAHL